MRTLPTLLLAASSACLLGACQPAAAPPAPPAPAAPAAESAPPAPAPPAPEAPAAPAPPAAPVAAADTAVPASSLRVFYCRTNSNKTVELFDEGSTIRYVYTAANGKPEMVLAVPRARATTWQWEGVGRSMTYRVNVPNGDTVYSVFWSAERDPDAAEPVSAGVDVQIRGAHAATVNCRPDTADSQLEGIDLAPEGD